MGNQEWAAVVNRDGIVRAVAFSGNTRADEWPGSRIIAEKANTANGLSGRDYGVSTANVYGASQPDQSLYSLATSAPPKPAEVFGTNPAALGTVNDPWWASGSAESSSSPADSRSTRPTVNSSAVFDLSVTTPAPITSSRGRFRAELELDAVPMGPSPAHNDNMILDFQNGSSPSGFDHPSCRGGMQSDTIIRDLSKNFPTGPHR
jgi:hypothetical protein